jgi:hypothetical protein
MSTMPVAAWSRKPHHRQRQQAYRPTEREAVLHHHSLFEKRCFIAAPVLLGLPFTAPLYSLNLQQEKWQRQ